MNTSEIKIEKLAEALEYTFIENGDCLMVHKNGDFSKISSDKVSGRKFQGWTECVCAETLESLLGINIETSEDGIKEAEIVSNWMKSQK